MIMTGWVCMSRRLLILASPRVAALSSMVTLAGDFFLSVDLTAEGAAAFSFFLPFLDCRGDSPVSVPLSGGVSPPALEDKDVLTFLDKSLPIWLSLKALVDRVTK